MVGVPGKYKGCNTCRTRRVKCDNERPSCKKCTESGRECQGYERKTIFIVSTIENNGRCSSHPPRVLKDSKKAKSPTKIVEEGNKVKKLELVPIEPLQPAWDDLVSLSSAGTVHHVQIAALHTNFQTVFRHKEEDDRNKFKFIGFPPYTTADRRPPLVDDDDFELCSQCLVDLSPAEYHEASRAESILLFLYEHNYSVLSTNLAPWRDPNRIRKLGPESFKTFPAHHFFVRVYRHNAICTALLNRRDTFLAAPEWLFVPWESHPKSPFDQLFDVIALLPSLLSRVDHCLPHDPTLPRRLLAQDLLGNCLNLHTQFQQWHTSVLQSTEDQSHFFWIQEQDGTIYQQIPFADTFAFRDSVTALMFIYFWSSLVVFCPCIEQLQLAIFEPVLDAFPQVFPNLPQNLHIDTERYSAKEVRDMVANICRSLDFTLGHSVQPDMLAVPVYIVEQFYNSMNMSTGDGAMELLWLDDFKQRMILRGQNIADVIQSRKWMDMAEF